MTLAKHVEYLMKCCKITVIYKLIIKPITTKPRNIKNTNRTYTACDTLTLKTVTELLLEQFSVANSGQPGLSIGRCASQKYLFELTDFHRANLHKGPYLSSGARWSRCYYGPLIGSDVAYQIVLLPMTLSDLQGHSPIASNFKWYFSYSYAAVDKTSTDIVRDTVPL